EEEERTEVLITAALLDRWFAATSAARRDGRPNLAQRLAAFLTPEERSWIEALCRRQLLGRQVAWQSRVLYLVGR
ncbi:MAG: hypothetical protein NZP34_00415, partial [Caldilineales bacterium]|nr:hypothetical protein [Caldilineales bacterium]